MLTVFDSNSRSGNVSGKGRDSYGGHEEEKVVELYSLIVKLLASVLIIDCIRELV